VYSIVVAPFLGLDALSLERKEKKKEKETLTVAVAAASGRRLLSGFPVARRAPSKPCPPDSEPTNERAE
jgi:hypothetical protein